MGNNYTFRNLSESEVENLLGAVATQKLYKRVAVETNIKRIDLDGSFLDGTPKYFVKIETDDKELIERINNRKIKK